MRGTEAVENWYRYSRKSFYNELFTQTIMQGVWNDVRKSDKFDSGFKEDMRVMKRQYIMYSGDLTFGFDPNVTKALHETHGHELDELRNLANKRLTELGPDGEGPADENGRRSMGNYFDNYDRDFTDKGKTRNIGREYRNLILAHNKAMPTEKPIRDDADTQERAEVRHKAGFTMYDQVSQNLASDEFTLMPGNLRNLYVVMRNMEVNQLEHYRSRDLDVKIPMVEFFIKQFRDEVLGIREMSRKNLQIFTWFVNQGGQNFIPWEQIRPELQDYWEQIKGLIGREDARTLPGKYGRLRSYAAQGRAQDAPVMKRINELREAEGLPPLDGHTQPFGRIGAVA
jgi:hypothetical protein